VRHVHPRAGATAFTDFGKSGFRHIPAPVGATASFAASFTFADFGKSVFCLPGAVLPCSLCLSFASSAKAGSSFNAIVTSPRPWVQRTLARELTKKPILVNDDSGDIVNPKLTIVNWRESHFRAFLKHLYPCAWVKQTVRLSERFLVSSHPRARGCNPCGMTLVPQGVQSARIRPAIRLPRILCSASIF